MSTINLHNLECKQSSVISHEEMSQINGGEEVGLGQRLVEGFLAGVASSLTVNEIGNGFENVSNLAEGAALQLGAQGTFPDAGTTSEVISTDVPSPTDDFWLSTDAQFLPELNNTF